MFTRTMRFLSRLSRRKAWEPCPCCRNLTLGWASGDFEICPVCFWEDDPFQLRHPDLAGGANPTSLIQARANYVTFGANCERDRIHVREPYPEELPERG